MKKMIWFAVLAVILASATAYSEDGHSASFLIRFDTPYLANKADEDAIKRFVLKHKGRKILIEGHAGLFCSDSNGRMVHSKKSASTCMNMTSKEWALAIGEREAGAIKSLIVHWGVAKNEDIYTISYGSEAPVVQYPPNGSIDDWNIIAIKNNRVVLIAGAL
jgi:outer membrane protein OmpA-like peptidoglycan-associated protein